MPKPQTPLTESLNRNTTNTQAIIASTTEMIRDGICREHIYRTLLEAFAPDTQRAATVAVVAVLILAEQQAAADHFHLQPCPEGL